MKLINLSISKNSLSTDFPIVIARTKLVDRNIHWKEEYTPDTAYFYAMFEATVGLSSYYRFVGTDADSGEKYFAVIGPAKMHDPQAKFFAGTRKLPSDYAASGCYYSEIMEAIKYAMETWGLPIPHNTVLHYTSNDLKGLGAKMDEWRAQNDKATVLANFKKVIAEEYKGEDDNDEDYEEEVDIEASSIGLKKQAAGNTSRRFFEGDWWDINEVFTQYQVEAPIDFYPDPIKQKRGQQPRNGSNDPSHRIPAGTILIQDTGNPYLFTRQDNNQVLNFRHLINREYLTFPYRKLRAILDKVAMNKMQCISQGDEKWQALVQENPDLAVSLKISKQKSREWYIRAVQAYSEEDITHDNLRYHLWYGVAGNKGHCAEGESSGPYLGKNGRYVVKAGNKFGVFPCYLNHQPAHVLEGKMQRHLAKIGQQYGLDLGTIDTASIYKKPEEVIPGHYSTDDKIVFKPGAEGELYLAMYNKTKTDPDYAKYAPIFEDFVGEFNPVDPEWKKANKGWEDKAESKLLSFIKQSFLAVMPEEAPNVENITSIPELKKAMDLCYKTATTEGGSVKSKQPLQIKEMAQRFKARIAELKAAGQPVDIPPFLLSLNCALPREGGQLFSGAIRQTPKISVESTSPNSPQIVVRQIPDGISEPVNLEAGLAFFIRCKNTDAKQYERSLGKRPFVINAVQPQDDGSIILTLNMPVPQKPNNSIESHLIFTSKAGFVSIPGREGELMDLSLSDRDLAIKHNITDGKNEPDVDQVKELRESLGWKCFGLSSMTQCMQTVQNGNFPKGFTCSPLEKDYTSEYMKAAKLSKHNPRIQKPELQAVAPEVNESLGVPVVVEAQAGVDQGFEQDTENAEDEGGEENEEVVGTDTAATAPVEAPVAPVEAPAVAPTAPSPNATAPAAAPADPTAVIDQGVQDPLQQNAKPAKKKPVLQPTPDAQLGQQELFSSTWNKLIRLAAELDEKGQGKESEEIHRILRKHQSRLTDFDIWLEK